jgi:hypothetical protein
MFSSRAIYVLGSLHLRKRELKRDFMAEESPCFALGLVEEGFRQQVDKKQR